MASKYTENYGLCQWEAKDQVLREEFNGDHAKIDGVLTELAKQVAGKAEQSTVSNLVSTRNCQVYFTTYIGTGSGSNSFTFPGRPLLVMAMGLGIWLTVMQGQSQGQSRNGVTRSSYVNASWGGNSVTWTVSNDQDLQCNRKDTQYSLVAILQV